MNQTGAEQGDLITSVLLLLPTVYMLPVSQNLIVDLFSDDRFQNGRLILIAPVPYDSLSVMKLIIFSINNLYTTYCIATSGENLLVYPVKLQIL